MPVSKKPRKTSSRSPGKAELASLPNPVTLEAEGRLSGPWPDNEALGDAQDLVYEAWETEDGRSRYALARRALQITPLCADAWLILAERPSLSASERREYLERAVKAGELALGEGGFAQCDGHFWGFLETRPYMRARHQLAEDLWSSGDREAAVRHLRGMLVLNPGDNQGLRYILLAWLLTLRDDAAVEDLLRTHSDEASAFICYTRALFAFRRDGDSVAARLAAAEAWGCNRHVPGRLARKTRPHLNDTGYYILGGEDEAAYYVDEYGFAWRETPGAVGWLVNITKTLTPLREGRATLH
ncbi:hypothetical protein [Salipiger mucosus]|uniref:ST7 protein n=1 Tax=Salipiger mucosus DSM 16094 TaxID=1123237 RepID=S9RNY9_9RHOB|nr:hypothetical protein [Salipiger mucosus]EPX75699.1 hypothetical protein Salmuc_01164 [Salipiger mucosus DSM 16094]